MTAYTDFHYSPTGSGVISGAQVLEQTEQGINGLGQYVQDNVSGAIDTANQALTTAQNADSNATAAINLANSFNAQIIAANQTAGNALTTAQSAQNTANSASSLATTANNSAATALNTANAASAGVTALTGTVNSLGNRMTAAENNISTNAGNITTLQNNLATTNANVTAAANAASSAQATATSAQATATLARNQAYVLRYTGTTITGGGTIAYADIDNTDNIKAGDKIIDISGAIYAIASVDTANQTVTVGASPVINLFCDAENLIPAANDAYDLGSASKQWLNTYSKGYYYNGVAWGLNVKNTWTNFNVINGYRFEIRQTAQEIGVIPSSNQWNGFYFVDKNESSTVAFEHAFMGSGETRFKINMVDNYASHNSTVWIEFLRLYTSPDTSAFCIGADARPLINNTYNLGTSTIKWKTLNGINPGALSLPDYTLANVDFIDFSQWSVAGQPNAYTPISDGWLLVNIKDTASNSVFIYAHGLYNADPTKATDYSASCFGNGSQGLDGRIAVMLPVRAGIVYRIYIKAASVSEIYSAKFYPALGNV